ncbi:MAG: nucleotidyltransferase family protein [Thermoguttaceae bacterium]
MKAMILAAGEGTRLRPYTLSAPKPMLPVAGKPTVEWILLWLRYFGIRDVVMNLSYRPADVVQYFGDGSSLDMNLTFSVEEKILGTSGGIKRVERLFTESFVVVYGDVLTDMDLGEFMRFHAACDDRPHVTLSLFMASNPWECGIVAIDDQHRVTRFVEKPPRDQIFSNLTNAGILMLDPPILEHIPADGFHDISHDLLPKLLERGIPLYAQPLEKEVYLIDIGTPEKYQRVQTEWPTARMRRCLEL